MQSSPGHSWQVGAIANGHVLAADGGWVQLNLLASHAGPWRPGDVVNQYAFTGTGWVALPAGWWPDATGRHQIRWWTGTAWSQAAMTSERHFNDPIPQLTRPYPGAPPSPSSPPARMKRQAFWTVLYVLWKYRSGPGLYGENILAITLTGKTRNQLAMMLLRAIRRWRYYVFSGALAAGGVALSVHFDNPRILNVTLGVTMFTLAFAWVFS